MDENQVSLLSLLDLSAAFDTFDHGILLSRLEHTLGISGQALSWFRSYLSDRTQTVHVNGCFSSPSVVSYGVPQGSVLGPILFVLYTQPLCNIVARHSFQHHSFSDDNQLYKSGDISQLSDIFESTKSCIHDIKSWMTSNKLQLNEEKTECLLVAKKTVLSKAPCHRSITLNGSEVQISRVVRNLGVHVDASLSFQQQVSHICRICYLELRRISSIRQYLTEDATKTLICSFVLSRLDYCNSLLAGSPKYLLLKLQKVQNSAARLIFRAPGRTQASPLLHSLHWLPVEERISYKLSLLCFKSLNGLAPSYLRDFLQLYKPSRNLRSSSDSRICKLPLFRTVTYGRRSFSYQAAHAWNQLPYSVRHSCSLSKFKPSLKTALFPNSP